MSLFIPGDRYRLLEQVGSAVTAYISLIRDLSAISKSIQLDRRKQVDGIFQTDLPALNQRLEALGLDPISAGNTPED